MPLDFPNSPSTNDTYVYNDKTYTFDGVKWTTEYVPNKLNPIDDTTTTTLYPVMVPSANGDSEVKITSTKFEFNAATGELDAVDFNSTSDVNLKKDIELITNGNYIISQLNPVSFRWVDNDGKSNGVIAQELEKIIPEAVKENSEGIKSVSYHQIIPFLISAIQELQREINKHKE